MKGQIKVMIVDDDKFICSSLTAILKKLELRDRTQLAIYYYKKPGV